MTQPNEESEKQIQTANTTMFHHGNYGNYEETRCSTMECVYADEIFLSILRRKTSSTPRSTSCFGDSYKKARSTERSDLATNRA
jgi:hypothetical protein